MDSQVIILGGGISGLTAGYGLASRGISVTVIEASQHAGGLAGTQTELPYHFDFGPHSFFSDDREVSDFVLGLFHPRLQPVPRTSAFFFQGRYLNYPITAEAVLFQMGLFRGLRAAFSFLTHKIGSLVHPSPKTEEMSVKDWAIANFGPYLFHSFFKPYTEQFWKLSSNELSAASIPSHTRTGFLKALKLLLQQKSSSDNAVQIERETLPTYYPPYGYGEIPDKVAELMIKAGGVLLTNAKAAAIHVTPEGFRVEYVQGGKNESIRGAHLISTLPLSVLIPMMRPKSADDILFSAQQLHYRPLINLGMIVDKQNALPCSYYYTLGKPYNRLSEMNKFSPLTSPPGENIIGAEIPCAKDDPIWNASKEDLFELCIGSLEKDRILKRSEVKGLLLAKAKYAYPIYRLGYETHLSRVLHYLKELNNFYTVGRSGEFRYMDLDQCVRRALDLADRLYQKNYSSLPVPEHIPT